MQIDPVQEWQRLAAEYREKYDNELLELARDYGDLTEAAQQALRSEMRSRGLGDPASPIASVVQRVSETNFVTPPPTHPVEERAADVLSEGSSGLLGFGARAPQLVPDTPDTDDKDDGPHEYTWKTFLCDCETNQEAQQLAGVLRKAGIDSWIQQAREFGRLNARVQVAADQLDQARAIAAQTRPQEIVEEEKEEAQEFVEPKCPKCGSDDVVLEGVDPENTWRCEQCDEQWTETPPQPEGEGPEAATNPF
jgi:ribosomal protein L37AE/L43A